jgi:hypothetical protein
MLPDRFAVALLVLAVDEDSTAYRVGYVVGRIAVIAAIVALVVFLVRRSSQRRAAAGSPQAPATPPPGWHPDPQGQARLRWWDGTRWTEHTAD